MSYSRVQKDPAGPPQLCLGWHLTMKQAHSQETSTHIIPPSASRLHHCDVMYTCVCSSVQWACSCDHSLVTSRAATSGAPSYPLSQRRLPLQPPPLISTVLSFKMPCGWNQFVAFWNGPFSLGTIPLWTSRLLHESVSSLCCWFVFLGMGVPWSA